MTITVQSYEIPADRLKKILRNYEKHEMPKIKEEIKKTKEELSNREKNKSENKEGKEKRKSIK